MEIKSKCPLCPKSYQSLKDLEKHCKKYHNVDLMKVREMQSSVPRIRLVINPERFDND